MEEAGEILSEAYRKGGIMAYMKQPRICHTELQTRRRQLAMFRERMTDITVSMSDMPGSPTRNVSGMENGMVDIIAVGEQARVLAERLKAMEEIMGKVIGTLDESSHRTVLVMRYLDLMPWNYIVTAMGYSSAQVFRLHKAGLQAMDKKLRVNET